MGCNIPTYAHTYTFQMKRWDKYMTLKLITLSRLTSKIIHQCIQQALNNKLHQGNTLVEVKVIMQIQEVCFRHTSFHLRMGSVPFPETISLLQVSSCEPRKVPISFILPVCPSACISTVPIGEIFIKFDTGDFYKHVKKLQVWVNSDKNIMSFT